jgi:uncharacterized protein YecE (DUF72 family)
MVYVGTSGYSYDDWVGPFYPPGLPRNRFLDHYAQHFGCVEVNYTYYRMPDARTLGAMAAKTAPGFRFAVKATGELTHERKTDPALYRQFREALAPLSESGRLACILAQFPTAFQPGPLTTAFLTFFAEQFSGLPVVVEFRSSRWIGPATFDLLRTLGVGFCCVDEPRLSSLMPPVVEATSGVGYVRFHGRNAAKWFTHDEAWERYNYLYPKDELAEWVGKVGDLAARTKETYLFFNNHYNAQAVQNAMQFVELLAEDGSEPV